MKIISYIHKVEISPLRCTSVVRSESDGLASKQMRLGRASMTWAFTTTLKYTIRLDLSAAVEVTYMLTINQALVISTEAMA